MRMHYLQHVPFEGLANIAVWAQERDFTITRTSYFELEPLPPVNEVDWLVVMGGPMNIYEEDRYPWLAAEKRYIAKAIEAGKTVLGVCLGAQLIADVLGGPVTRNAFKEIGWLPVTLTEEAAQSPLFRDLPHSFLAFHWHGDTFATPPGALRVAESAACANQAFVYDHRVVGLQFHLESSPESVQLLIEHGGDELVDGPYIQSAAEMLAEPARFAAINGRMRALLDGMSEP